MKAIRKVILFFGFSDLSLFDQWRNDISNITIVKEIKTNLVFSIHPIDYMTMSDNQCNWSSCMSWRDGSYSNGTVEMMNSNMVIVAYLESNKPFYFDSYLIPNKSWRCLFYVHKQIICAGKSYPYCNDALTLLALGELESLLQKKLHWKYQYRNQKYKDLVRYNSNETLRHRGYDSANYKKIFHRILIYTLGMYNDLIEDNATTYWCCRNYVKKTLQLNASGPYTCLCCGKVWSSDSDECDDVLAGHDSMKNCSACEAYRCTNCQEVNPNKRHWSVYEAKFDGDGYYLKDKLIIICEDCINEYKYDILTDRYYRIEDFLRFKEQIQKEEHNFIPAYQKLL